MYHRVWRGIGECVTICAGIIVPAKQSEREQVGVFRAAARAQERLPTNGWDDYVDSAILRVSHGHEEEHSVCIGMSAS